MPHTNRKKKTSRPLKRQQITDEDGWTRVTSTRSSTMAPQIPEDGYDARIISSPYDDHIDSEMPFSPLYRTKYLKDPAHQAPAEATIEKVQKRYETIQSTWLASDSSKKLNQALSNTLKKDHKTSTCVIFGTGSFSGLRNNWIARHDVALLQVAVFVSVVKAIEQVEGARPACYAQEPNYNDLDATFLKAQDIEVKNNPEAFSLVDNSSFAYAPGAELEVELGLLFGNPDLTLSNDMDFYWRDDKGRPICSRKFQSCPGGIRSLSLEARQKVIHESALHFAATRENENECQIFERFMSEHDSIQIPDLDMKDFPFWGQKLYFRSQPTQPTKP